MMEKYPRIGRNINIADKYFRLYLRDALSPHGLNTAEGTVLLSMYGSSGGTERQIVDSIHGREGGGNTQDERIDDLHYDKGVMTRTMKSLEEKGFVQRSPNPADSRSYIFTLTEKGLDFKGTLIDLLRRWSDRLLAGIDEQTLSTVEKALAVMAENAVGFCRENNFKNAAGAGNGN